MLINFWYTHKFTVSNQAKWIDKIGRRDHRVAPVPPAFRSRTKKV